MIPTTSALRARHRRLDQRNIGVEGVLSELRRGACLRLSLSPRPHWRLSTGIFVTEEIARDVISRPSVVGCGDALFAGELAQTFRYIEE
jgi:hypothetical protein